jgi:quercetin dioxygenase-like cupin family protein
MEKLIDRLKSLGFSEARLSSRVIDNEEGVEEWTVLGNCSAMFVVLGGSLGKVIEPHTHDEVRLTFVRSGDVKMILGEETMAIGPGDFITIPPQVPHGFEALGEDPFRAVEFVILPTSSGEQ